MSKVKALQKALNRIEAAGLVEDGIAGPLTTAALGKFYNKLCERAGEPVKDFVAIRLQQVFSNSFDDFLFFFEQAGVSPLPVVVPCSTLAGHFYVKNPLSLQGTAVLKEGYYKRSHRAVITYRFGHRSVELIQVRPVVVYRDGNRDDKIDRDSPTQTGLFGINIHEAGQHSRVDRWSAGCVVVPREAWEKTIVPSLTIGQEYSLLLI